MVAEGSNANSVFGPSDPWWVVDKTDAPGSPDFGSSNAAIAGPSDAQSFECGDQPPPSTWHNSFSSREAALHDVADAECEMYRFRLMAAPAQIV